MWKLKLRLVAMMNTLLLMLLMVKMEAVVTSINVLLRIQIVKGHTAR